MGKWIEGLSIWGFGSFSDNGWKTTMSLLTLWISWVFCYPKVDMFIRNPFPVLALGHRPKTLV